MDGRTDPLNDAALEQEVEALLAVQPSPDFVARVRTRVAEESISSGWSWRWPIAAIATAVALVIFGVAVWQGADSTAPSTNVPTDQAAAERPIAPIVPTARDEQVVARAERRSTHVAAESGRTTEISLPPVIIAENEARAYASLVADRRATRFEFSPAIARTVDNPIEIAKMPAIDPVTVVPIEVEPLVKEATLE